MKTATMRLTRREVAALANCIIHAMEALSDEGRRIDEAQAVAAFEGEAVQSFLRRAGALAPVPRGQNEIPR